MVSPCIDVLRRLATHINHDLGARQGSKHTSPDLQLDIQELMDILTEFGVYEKEPGRTIETDKPAVLNAVSAGLSQLAGPLADFNSQLRRLQTRCTMTPVIGKPYIERQPLSATSETPEANPTPSDPRPSVIDAVQSAVTAPPSPTPPVEIPVPHDSESAGPYDTPITISAAEADEADELEYWAGVDEDDTERTPFSLDSAEDVALDMDVIDVE